MDLHTVSLRLHSDDSANAKLKAQRWIEGTDGLVPVEKVLTGVTTAVTKDLFRGQMMNQTLGAKASPSAARDKGQLTMTALQHMLTPPMTDDGCLNTNTVLSKPANRICEAIQAKGYMRFDNDPKYRVRLPFSNVCVPAVDLPVFSETLGGVVDIVLPDLEDPDRLYAVEVKTLSRDSYTDVVNPAGRIVTHPTKAAKAKAAVPRTRRGAKKIKNPRKNTKLQQQAQPRGASNRGVRVGLTQVPQSMFGQAVLQATAGAEMLSDLMRGTKTVVPVVVLVAEKDCLVEFIDTDKLFGVTNLLEQLIHTEHRDWYRIRELPHESQLDRNLRVMAVAEKSVTYKVV